MPSDWKADTSFWTSFWAAWLPGESTIAIPAETGSPSAPPAPIRRMERPRTTAPCAPRMPTPFSAEVADAPAQDAHARVAVVGDSLAAGSVRPGDRVAGQIDRDAVRPDHEAGSGAAHEIRRERRALRERRAAVDCGHARPCRACAEEETPSHSECYQVPAFDTHDRSSRR